MIRDAGSKFDDYSITGLIGKKSCKKQKKNILKKKLLSII